VTEFHGTGLHGRRSGQNMSAKLKILLAAKFSMMLRPEKIAQEISILRLQRVGFSKK
jgi:hypothetical protein